MTNPPAKTTLATLFITDFNTLKLSRIKDIQHKLSLDITLNEFDIRFLETTINDALNVLAQLDEHAKYTHTIMKIMALITHTISLTQTETPN